MKEVALPLTKHPSQITLIASIACNVAKSSSMKGLVVLEPLLEITRILCRQTSHQLNEKIKLMQNPESISLQRKICNKNQAKMHKKHTLLK